MDKPKKNRDELTHPSIDERAKSSLLYAYARSRSEILSNAASISWSRLVPVVEHAVCTAFVIASKILKKERNQYYQYQYQYGTLVVK